MKREERAAQIWQVLTSAAHNRQIITYEEVARLIGMGPGTLAGPLGCIMYYCEQQGLPPLTSLVVKKRVGRPGVGLTSVRASELDAKRQEVFRHRWFRRLPPSPLSLATAYNGS
jgi:hypothetical protein